MPIRELKRWLYRSPRGYEYETWAPTKDVAIATLHEYGIRVEPASVIEVERSSTRDVDSIF